MAGGGWFLVPGECVWLVAYPLLVPSTPTKILVTSLLAASMGPVGLFISAAANGAPVGRPIDAVVYFLTSNYLCAVIAYVIAHIVHRVHVQLKNAREIGSYQLIERIGSGGMGEVWQAQHRLLVRTAAIKLIRSDIWGKASGTGRCSRGASSVKPAPRLRSAPFTPLTSTILV